MKNIRFFLFENFSFLVVKFSIYLNRRIFVMIDDVNYCSLIMIAFPLRSTGKTLTSC